MQVHFWFEAHAKLSEADLFALLLILQAFTDYMLSIINNVCRNLRFLALSWKTLILLLATSSTTVILMTFVSETIFFICFVSHVQLHTQTHTHIYTYELGNYLHFILVNEYICYFNAANINSSSIVAAASLVARTLYIQAGGQDPSTINNIKINASLVEELLGCLLNCEPGLSCEMVKHYITPSTTCPSHYVGVILGEPSSAPYPPYAGDISRFVWNFLADKTSIPSQNLSSTCAKGCNLDGELCIRREVDEKGACVISTTR